jgi:hypothetical protein
MNMHALLCGVFLCGSAGVETAAFAGEKTERRPDRRDVTPSKDALAAATMPDLHEVIRLQKGEFKWDAIPWYASIWHARRAAAQEDKPILVFGTGGAGFNDPLGNC